MTVLPHGASEEGSDRSAQLQQTIDLARLLVSRHGAGRVTAELEKLLEAEIASRGAGHLRSLGRARKVSVSLPEELTTAVQQRVGKGEFSHYVTEAVARQLELDLLAELIDLLDSAHGPVPEEFLAEARSAWPDAE
jgi:Arc/MetJ-type ribon-helix-helix transcriptional regulator